jgi:hypothetical protein
MASTHATVARDRNSNVVPAHVIARKRRERAERKRLLANTMAAQAISEEAAAAQ